MTAKELLQAGKLKDAIDAAIAEVKKHPTDSGRRFFLAELCCFAGDFERADRQLETLMQQADESAVKVTLFRQLLRAETARQQFYSEGRLPEFLFEPTEALRLHLDASIALREGNKSEAFELLEKAESLRPRLAGTCDGKKFDDFRDLDDLTAGFFEVFTSTGKYYWVPAERVESLEFLPPQRSMDLLWRPVQICVTDGPDGVVYLPTIYVDTLAGTDDQLRLGRGTDWLGGDGEPVRGVGQRAFLVGDDSLSILQLGRLEFDRPEEDGEAGDTAEEA